MEHSARDEVAWALMDFGPTRFAVDHSTAADRIEIVVDYLIDNMLKNPQGRTGMEIPTDLMADLMGSHYF
ncbi:MAG: hypothetical protein KJN81_07230 [Acidimicrobiia bacterium]|nr:hypothetical protein [Acidimicrobiia bacterium]NNL28205.1 hypothetical protein [Acidimicrobiia bacterium]